MSEGKRGRARAWAWPSDPVLRWERAGLALTTVAMAHLAWLVAASDLSNWDAAGHVAAVEYAARHFWPWPYGWNHLSLFGAPQGYLYPPLVHWVAAGLAQVVSAEAALKLLVVPALLLQPAALLGVLRRAQVRGRDAFAGGALAIALLLESRYQVGGEAFGTLVVGLLPAAIAHPLMLAAVCRLHDAATEERAVGPAGLLAGLVLLSHVFVTMGLALWGAVLALTVFRAQGRAGWGRLARVGGLALLVGSAWLVPFLASTEHATGLPIPGLFLAFYFAQMGAPADVLVVALAVAGVAAVVKPALAPRLLGLFALVTLLAAVLLDEVDAVHPLPALHVHRLLPFILVPAFAWAGAVLARLARWPAVALAAAMLLHATATLRANTAVALRHELELPRQALQRDGRGLTCDGTQGPLWRSQAPHVLHTTLTRAGQPMAQGLFVESSATSPYTQSVGLELWPDFVWWGVQARPAVPEHAGAHLRMLGVQWLLSRQPVADAQLAEVRQVMRGELPATYRVDGVPLELRLDYRRLDVPVAELVEQGVRTAAGAQWTPLVDEWWKEGDPSWLPVESATPLDFEAPLPGERAVMVAPTEAEAFDLEVQAAAERWVYVKVPYFSRWQATDERGARLRVLRAGAQMMAVRARGPVHFRFVRAWYEPFSLGLGALGVAWALVRRRSTTR